jgi:tRNA-2-methylthio-N6-dimethylallyladenosine synthase
MVEGRNDARGQVIGRTSQNITLNFTTSSEVPETGTYANVLVTKSFPNSLVGQMVE